jgi:hypothetical protein
VGIEFKVGDRIEDVDGIRGTVDVSPETGLTTVNELPGVLWEEVYIRWDWSGDVGSTPINRVRKLSLLEVIAEAAREADDP